MGRLFPVVSTLAAVLNIGANLVLIPAIGVAGAALASTLSYTLAALWYLMIFSREKEIPATGILIPTSADIDAVRDSARRYLSTLIHRG